MCEETSLRGGKNMTLCHADAASGVEGIEEAASQRDEYLAFGEEERSDEMEEEGRGESMIEDDDGHGLPVKALSTPGSDTEGRAKGG